MTVPQRPPAAYVHAALAVIAAGALQDAHGKDWKEHVTDLPDSLKDIA